MTLANKLQTAYVNNTRWEDIEQVAREHLIEEMFVQAADLFDPNTTLNIEKNEYERGVVELITRVTGSDDKEDVAEIISERTGTHRVTAADFGTGINGDLLYIGPVQQAIDFIKGPNQSEVEETVLPDGKWSVKLDGGNVWGTADTKEMAWRYAIAAEFGPIDEEFVPFLLFGPLNFCKP